MDLKTTNSPPIKKQSFSYFETDRDEIYSDE